MKKLVCEIGDTFGDGTVIETGLPSKNGHTRVKCKCKCGFEREISITSLYQGKTKRCKSCSAHLKTTPIDIGYKNGELTVIAGPKYFNRTAKYLVKCSCGRETGMLPIHILSPTTYMRCMRCARQLNIENQGKRTHYNGLTLKKFIHYRDSATARELDFDLTMEYLWNLYENQKRECAITGDYLPDINNASLDRIDSTKGYVKDNVQGVTKQANLSKHIMTNAEFVEFCKKVINHANQQPSLSSNTFEGSETNARVLPDNAGDSNGDTSAKRVCRRDYGHGEIVRYFTEK